MDIVLGNWLFVRGYTERIAGACVCLTLVLVPFGSVYGQEHTVSGTVTDVGSGDPLPGVNVQVVGTTVGVATNTQGQYEVDAPSATDTLRFTFVGYESQTIPIGERSTINVELQSTTLTGGEVVITGYSAQQKRDLTGSVEVVNTADMQRIEEAQITDQLQGMAAGVNVISSGQPGKEPQIRIRGFNTFGNNKPLFVVDGVPTQRIENLSPRDIAEIQVLKDASAASIYGSRASNGVVIIETKKGEGDLTIEVNSSAGVSTQPAVGDNPWDIVSPREQGEIIWRQFRNSGVEPSHPIYGDGEEPVVPDFILPEGAMEGDPGTDPNDYFVIPEYTDPSQLENFHQIVRANKEGTAWFDEVMRTAPKAQMDLTVSGAGEQGTFLFSTGYLNQQSTLLDAYLKRYSLRVNTSYNKDFGGFVDNVRVGENLSLTAEQNKLGEELVEDDPVSTTTAISPIIPVHDIMGNWAGTRPNGLGANSNPVAERRRTRNDRNLDKRAFGNAFVEVTFLEDFRLRTLFGGELNSGFNEQFQFPTYEQGGNQTTNALTERAWNNFEWTWTNTLNYDRTFGANHNVTALAGVEWTKESSRFEQGRVESFFSFDPDFTNLANGTGTKTIDSGTLVTTLASQFGKIDYNYAGKYLLSGMLRRDGSSKFLNNRHGLFPAVSAGWRISEENFVPDIHWLSDLKIRAGWGIMGNQLNVAPNNAFSLFENDSFAFDITDSGTQTELGFFRSRLGAPNARWEKDKSLNIGIDLAVLDGQVEATVDYYRKDIEDLLFNPEIPATAGAAEPPFINVAAMENTGIDASLRGETGVGDLQIRANANVTSYNNEIKNIAEGFDSFEEEPRRFFGQNIVRNEVGHEMSSFYGYNIVGFWQSEDEIEEANAQAPDGEYQSRAAPGRFRYEDVNSDGQITDADRTFLGSPNPDFTYGINVTVSYHSWDFSASLFGSQGVEAWNQVKWWTDFRDTFASTAQLPENSWSPDNRDAEAPRVELDRTFSNGAVPSSYFVEDASYLRIQHLQLGYSLPARWVQRVGGQSLRFYVKGSNLFTITGYSNPEPELGANDPGDVTSFAIDSGAFPTPRQFTGGISLTF